MTIRETFKSYVAEVTDPLQAALLTLAEAINNESEAMLTAEQVSAMFKVDVRTIRRRVTDGTFPAPIRVGRSLRWRRTDLERLW